MPWRINIDDDIYKDVAGSSSIPEYSSDPASPNPEDAWVLKTISGGSGTSGKVYAYAGLGFPLIEAGGGGGTPSYQFSYYTLEGTIIRTSMS